MNWRGGVLCGGKSVARRKAPQPSHRHASFCIASPIDAMSAPPAFACFKQTCDIQNAAILAQVASSIAEDYNATDDMAIRTFLMKFMIAVLLQDRKLPEFVANEILDDLVKHARSTETDLGFVHTSMNLLKVVDSSLESLILSSRALIPPIGRKPRRRNKNPN